MRATETLKLIRLGLFPIGIPKRVTLIPATAKRNNSNREPMLNLESGFHIQLENGGRLLLENNQ